MGNEEETLGNIFYITFVQGTTTTTLHTRPLLEEDADIFLDAYQSAYLSDGLFTFTDSSGDKLILPWELLKTSYIRASLSE